MIALVDLLPGFSVAEMIIEFSRYEPAARITSNGCSKANS